MSQVHIIGGGIIGLSTAWYLQEAGMEVTVLDQGDFSQGTSHGNAGMIVPSHFVPLASPGVIAKGLKWLFKARSPLYIQPRLNWELGQWLWQFYRACNAAKVEQAVPVLHQFQVWSKELYQEWAANWEEDLGFGEKGLLMLYRTAKLEAEEQALAAQAHEIGMAAQVLSPTEIAALEPNIRIEARGAVYFPGDTHLDPHLVMLALRKRLQAAGVKLLPGQSVTGFSSGKGKVTSLSLADGSHLPVQQLVIAAGSWTAQLARMLGIRMLLQGGKGYSLTLPAPAIRPEIPTILSEAKVAITPMGKALRIGGTLEIGPLTPRINANRLAGIVESLPQYYPDLQPPVPPQEKVWTGFRPCTPDGLPYIGPASEYGNLTLATGHGMMGMSLGPATGKLIAQMLTGRATSIPTALFRPERY